MIRKAATGVAGSVGLALLTGTGVALAADPAPTGSPLTPSAPAPSPRDVSADTGAHADSGRIPRARDVEVGVNVGMVSRPADGDAVTYTPGLSYGGFARVEVLPWLAVRTAARIESSTASPRGGTLGIAGAHFPDADLVRPYLSASVEPTWSPIARLGLWLGVGVGWGRTVCPSLRSVDASNVVVPSRAAVFVDFPLSLGARFEVIPDWLTLSASASVSFLSSQSGRLVEPVRTPDQTGQLATVSAFPELGSSFSALAGIAVLL